MTECKVIKIGNKYYDEFLNKFKPKWKEFYKLSFTEINYLLNQRALKINYPKENKSYRKYLSNFLRVTSVLNLVDDLKNPNFDFLEYDLVKFEYSNFSNFKLINREEFLDLVNKKIDIRILAIPKVLSISRLNDFVSPQNSTKGNKNKVLELIQKKK